MSDNLNYAVTIQSANRASNVPSMTELFSGVELHWVVPLHNVDEYKAAGAKIVHGVSGTMPMKHKQLNYSLDIFNNSPEVQFIITCDDDLISVGEVYQEGTAVKTRKVSPLVAIENTLENARANLSGFANTTNAFFLSREYKDYGMLCGGFLFHKKNNGIYFDESLHSNEDLDLIIQHHLKFGGVTKNENFIVKFKMLSKRETKVIGGYSDLRTIEKETWNANHITEKYKDPDVIVEFNGLGVSNYKKVKWRALNKRVIDKVSSEASGNIESSLDSFY